MCTMYAGRYSGRPRRTRRRSSGWSNWCYGRCNRWYDDRRYDRRNNRRYDRRNNRGHDRRDDRRNNWRRKFPGNQQFTRAKQFRRQRAVIFLKQLGRQRAVIFLKQLGRQRTIIFLKQLGRQRTIILFQQFERLFRLLLFQFLGRVSVRANLRSNTGTKRGVLSNFVS